MALLSVENALESIMGSANPLESENVGLTQANGRILSSDLEAKRTQPPFDASAMDGYAVRARDVEKTPKSLKIIGEVPAGHQFKETVNSGEAVRIFTGAPMPEGTDSVLIQENAGKSDEGIVALEKVVSGQFVRPKGLDFTEGDVLLTKGTKLSHRDISLAASMNLPLLPVHRKPRVGILSTGDELVMPGKDIGTGQIVASNNFGLCAFVEQTGGAPIDLGVATDDSNLISRKVEKAVGCGVEVLVTTGGASVGDHDLIHSVMESMGMDLKFWRIAMRPGKPLLFGHLDNLFVLGLPGNPVSTLVCSIIFLKPLLMKLLGQNPVQETITAKTSNDLSSNDERQDYLRAVFNVDSNGERWVRAFSKQDSSMLAVLAKANCLIVRKPHEPAVSAGSEVTILEL